MLKARACPQVAPNAMPTADAHHAMHPPGVHSRGGGGGRKLGESHVLHAVFNMCDCML